MAIIYSYPVEATPTTSDLLLGTSIKNDSNPTKTYTIGSLASLVTANSGTGTVTNVATANSTFINKDITVCNRYTIKYNFFKR